MNEKPQPATRPGYVQTDLGEIPSDWTSGAIGDLDPFVTSGSRGWADYYSDFGSSFVRITNLSRATIYIDTSDLRCVQLPANATEGARTQLQDGDLLVSITADIGIVGFVDASLPKPAYINQHIALVRIDGRKADSKYLSYFLASHRPQRNFLAATDQGAKAGMNLDGVRKVAAIFPPIPEQRAIAAALSDVDALIGALDRLIAKKRDLKQAAMQQLLTGQTRLPGFREKVGTKQTAVGAIPVDWEALQVRNVCRLVNGRGFKPHEWEADGLPIIRIQNLNGSDDFNYFSGQYDPKILVEHGQLLFAWSGSRGTSFGPHIWRGGRALLNYHTWKVVVNESKVSSRFLFYALRQLTSYIEDKAHGASALVHTQKWEMEKFVIPIASKASEQAAIAVALADIDAELLALGERRTKARMLKQGMMQELLTGRIRLV